MNVLWYNVISKKGTFINRSPRVIENKKMGVIMAISEAKKKANKKWNDENLTKLYDRISLLVPKGKKDTIKAHADKNNESVNSFINRAIDEIIKNDG